MIVQNISHIPYDQFMLENILLPLGMMNSSFTQPPAKSRKLLATGYDHDGNEIPGKFHVYPEQAAAGLWTNVTDLAKDERGRVTKLLIHQTESSLNASR